MFFCLKKIIQLGTLSMTALAHNLLLGLFLSLAFINYVNAHGSMM